MAQNCSCHGSGGKHSRTVAAVLERPLYSPGLILEDSDLASAVEYTRSLSRLLFRNLFGCGVICGLVVTVERDCGLAVTVAAGLALDGCGDPVEVLAPITITIDKIALQEMEGRPQSKWPVEFWVVLCGSEKMCAPRPLVCDADEFEGSAQPTRARALAQVSLAFEPPECACACRLRNLPVQQFANTAPVEDEFDCQAERESRVECAPDCGCGTACACGCCLVLAHVRLVRNDSEELNWQATNRGVRRFIRPKLIDDPADRHGDTHRAASSYSADIEEGGRYQTASALLPELKPSDALTQDHVRQTIDPTAQRRAEPAAEIAKSLADGAAAQSAAGSANKRGLRARGKAGAAADGAVAAKDAGKDAKAMKAVEKRK